MAEEAAMTDMNDKVALVTGASSGIGRVAAEVERMVDHAIETFGRPDYAVNNAGIEGRFAPITELTEGEWDQVLGINLKGAFLCTRSEARAMLACGNGGAIVFPCSDAASYITGTTPTPDGGRQLDLDCLNEHPTTPGTSP